jgi:hypothetical protein
MIPASSFARTVTGFLLRGSAEWPTRIQLAFAATLWALSGLLVGAVAVLAHAARSARLGELSDLLPF